MKVRELITLLKGLDPEARVYMYNGYSESDSTVVDAVEVSAMGTFPIDGDSSINEHIAKYDEQVVVICDPEGASFL